MTHHAPPSPAAPGADPAAQIARLRELLRLVEQVAGREDRTEYRLDEAARLSDDYDRALPIVQRRFDLLAEEVASWATAGVEALVVAGSEGSPGAAAARLADRLDAALADLSGLLAGPR